MYNVYKAFGKHSVVETIQTLPMLERIVLQIWRNTILRNTWYNMVVCTIHFHWGHWRMSMYCVTSMDTIAILIISCTPWSLPRPTDKPFCYRINYTIFSMQCTSILTHFRDLIFLLVPVFAIRYVCTLKTARNIFNVIRKESSSHTPCPSFTISTLFTIIIIM